MGAAGRAETMVRRVAAESRLFLVEPALLAISVSGRAEGRARAGGGRTFLFSNLPPISVPPSRLVYSPADNPGGVHHHRRRSLFAFWDALKVDYLQEFGLGVFPKAVRC